MSSDGEDDEYYQSYVTSHLEEIQRKIVDWEHVKPKEYRKGEYVFRIIDNYGEEKITLERESHDGENITVVMTMPYDGHAFVERNICLKISVKKGNEIVELSTQAFRYFYCDHGKFLKKRGIDIPLTRFLRDYLLKKFVKEGLFPNIKDGKWDFEYEEFE